MFRIWSHCFAHLGLAFLLGVTFAVAVPAATRTVINISDSEPGSLRDAIDLAESGDTIVFDPSTNGTPIVLLTPIKIDKNLTLKGNSPALTQISGGGTVQVFQTGGTVTLDALTVTNGYADQGGGGVFNSGNLTVSNCIFSGNVAELSGSGSGFGLLGAVGGGLVNIGTVTVINTTFSGNNASDGGYGGGLANYYLTGGGR